MKRREFLMAAGAAVGAASAGGCIGLASRVASRSLPENPKTPAAPGFEQAVLNRLAFGPLPGEIDSLRNTGYEKFLARQLEAPVEDKDAVLLFQLSRLDVLRVHAAELRDLPEGEVCRQLRQATLLRQLYSPWQLRERMADFWTNHFNIFAERGDNAYRKPADDQHVVRRHALGNFHDLLVASAHSAAMLGYLNNDLNNKGVANENYAREIMELHTLGVHGGYSQKDVMELARCLTGWHIEQRPIWQQGLKPNLKDTYRFDDDLHDAMPATVLGHTFVAGEKGGDKALEMLANHPSTARYVVSKLCRYFLGDASHTCAPEAESAFLKSKGDIKSVLKVVLAERNLQRVSPLVKRPNDFVLSSLRAIGAESDCGPNLHAHLEAMGQPLFGWPMPDGYPDRTAAWTGSLMSRWNFAWKLAGDEIGGTWFNREYVDKHRGTLVAAKMTDDLRHDLALAISAPTFQWR